jgi:hypothetical protein
MEKRSIYEAIPEAIGKVLAVGKDHRNQTQGWKFRSIDDVYNAVNKAISEAGITICPEYRIITNVTKTTAKGGLQQEIVLEAHYKLYGTDGTFIEAVTYGQKLDSGDKAFNGAMSIAYKYMMFQVFCIPTEMEADPDRHTTLIEKPQQEKTQQQEKTGLISEPQLKLLHMLINKTGSNKEKLCEYYKVTSTKELTSKQAKEAIDKLKEKEEATNE